MAKNSARVYTTPCGDALKELFCHRILVRSAKYKRYVVNKYAVVLLCVFDHGILVKLTM